MKNLSIFKTMFLVCLGFCSTQAKDNQTQFTKEIPANKNGQPSISYNIAQLKAKQLNLESLENGYNSLQIRLWYADSSEYNHLLVIKQTDSLCSAKMYTMIVDWTPSMTDPIVSGMTPIVPNVKVKKEETLNPKSGWDDFLKKLLALQITTLPNMQNISGLIDTYKDGESYVIEIATKTQYRFYSYHVPEKFQDQYWQTKNIIEIMNLLRAELGI
jgi:hypothetical protein